MWSSHCSGKHPARLGASFPINHSSRRSLSPSLKSPLVAVKLGGQTPALNEHQSVEQWETSRAGHKR